MLAFLLDLCLLDLVSFGAVWAQEHLHWLLPISFATLYWGGFLFSLLIFRATPGMYLCRLRVREADGRGLTALRVTLRVATSYALFVIAPAMAATVVDALSLQGLLPASILSGTNFGFLIAAALTSILPRSSIQDVLSGTKVCGRHDSGSDEVPEGAPDYRIVRTWCGLGLVAGAWLTILGAYTYRLMPFDFEAMFSTLRFYDPSSFVSSQIGDIVGPVTMRQGFGSPFMRPLVMAAPYVSVEVPVNKRTIGDVGERHRVVDAVLRILAVLESAKVITGETAEVVVVAEWHYGFATHHVRYSYVGAWCVTGPEGQRTVWADGGLSKEGESVVQQKGKRLPTGGIDLWSLGRTQVPRMSFEDVVPKQQLSPTVTFVGAPRLDRDDDWGHTPWMSYPDEVK